MLFFSKTRRLLTASLATLRGNAPYTTSFLLRLFDYVNGWKDQEKSITEAKEKFKKGKIVDTTDTLNTEVRIKAALTLLDNCFALYTKDEAKRGAFNRLLKYLTLFNVQLLRREQLLNAKVDNFLCVKNDLHFWDQISIFEAIFDLNFDV